MCEDQLSPPLSGQAGFLRHISASPLLSLVWGMEQVNWVSLAAVLGTAVIQSLGLPMPLPSLTKPPAWCVPFL